MGSPDWSKIPFDKMPEWKRQEVLKRNKSIIKELEAVDFKCDVCGKVLASENGLKIHKSKHKK